MKTVRPATSPAHGVKRPSYRRVPVGVSYMRSPTVEYTFNPGDVVEALCDHEKGSDRVHGWLKGIVVQVDNKMVAVQFRTNVFLTDGWMVPDRILWYTTHSDQIRPAGSGKKIPPVVKKDIPDY